MFVGIDLPAAIGVEDDQIGGRARFQPTGGKAEQPRGRPGQTLDRAEQGEMAVMEEFEGDRQ